MTDTASQDRQAIVVDEVFSHSREVVWKTLTNGDLIGRWLMAPNGFKPVVGSQFTFQTRPAGEWDGTIHCEVLEVVENERLSYAWRGGHAGNEGYGSKLETVVTFILSSLETGTRLRLIHSGFQRPTNDTAYQNMSEGWKKVVKKLDTVIAEEASSTTFH
ncbi:SRPBCC domain-containing protein (plasmid) [Rhizobium grahamii]|uniref:SRPBCC domain-containing protein n=1 Tax=Rhizobium grahamii TaxID=1120045 RepID=A0A5Q0CHL7_9HYPH|nr:MULTISPECIES: SRPBCC domain-containing protein [Rhizobium]QFY63877.1 SRPBCC domain-containing protein [Rhizobium grahamii]QRM52878.1 SRPBCC domain-containing protein [Rhizobium sp. BG6]